MQKSSDITDIKLAPQGKLKIDWAGNHMPVLAQIQQRFAKEKPLKNITIGCCLHITAETANLLITLTKGGAKVIACASNPLSTQDDVAASLVTDFNIGIFAKKNEDSKTYYEHLEDVLDFSPAITLDDGADLVSLLHTKRKDILPHLFGSAEETTTGVIRLRAMEKAKKLQVPVIAVNDSMTKHFFDNRYGTGQSTIDGILRATNILLAGKKFVVAGYGWCGRGIAQRARGMGAQVIVTEVDPVKALEAVMDGFAVMRMEKAAVIGDIFVTATGDKNVIPFRLISQMKDGAILANAGHFDVEIDMAGLTKSKELRKKRKIREHLEEYVFANNKKIYVIAQGRLVNLSAAEGHPAEVMDMSFANQALAAEFILLQKGKLENKVYILPKNLDENVAHLKLLAMGVAIDTLTKEQKKYLSSWTEGTK